MRDFKRNNIIDKKIRLILAIIALLIILSAVCSCKTVRYVPLKEVRIDTVKIVAHDTIKVTQHSVPVSVPLPIVKLSNVTKDTVSTLTDGLYKSVANIRDGLLHHNLYTLPKANIDTNVQANDTLKIHNTNTNITKIDSVPKPYPIIKDKIVYELHWYQTIFVWIGVITSIILSIYIIMYLAKKNVLHL